MDTLRIYTLLLSTAVLLTACAEKISPEWTSWQPAADQQVRALFFMDAQNGFAAGGVRFSEDLLMNTGDGGQAWKRQTPLTGKSLFDIRFLDANRGFAAGLDGKVLRTLDGGENWQVFQLPYWKVMRAVQATNDSLVLAIGGNGYDDGIIVRSVDFGNTWAVIDTLDRELRDLVFVDDLTGFACGYGVIYRTRDGGLTWSLTPAEGEFFSAMSFPTPDTGYVVGRTGTILKTTDQGESWLRLRNGALLTRARHYYNDVVFLNTEIGYLAGDDGLLLKTRDGGKSWDKVEKPEKVDLYSLSVIREGLGFVGGDKGKIFRFEE